MISNHLPWFVIIQCIWSTPCIEGGDNKYTAIAAASILAKVARDDYIADICNAHPNLDEHTKSLKTKDMEQQHTMRDCESRITQFHRK